MSAQICFFRKSAIDLSNSSASVTVTDTLATDNGQAVANSIRNRNNKSAWVTTESSDAANTTLEADLGDFFFVTDIILIKHNFKNYTIQYYDNNSSSYVDFSTSINETDDNNETTHFEFNKIETNRVRIIINSTQTVDADKFLYQLIIADKIKSGKLKHWPHIKKPESSRNRKVNKTESAAVYVAQGAESFSCELDLKGWNEPTDIELINELYNSIEGFLVWISGGSEDQFQNNISPYRKEDIFLMQVTNELRPEWIKHYQGGLNIKIKLASVIE